MMHHHRVQRYTSVSHITQHQCSYTIFHNACIYYGIPETPAYRQADFSRGTRFRLHRSSGQPVTVQTSFSLMPLCGSIRCSCAPTNRVTLRPATLAVERLTHGTGDSISCCVSVVYFRSTTFWVNRLAWPSSGDGCCRPSKSQALPRLLLLYLFVFYSP